MWRYELDLQAIVIEQINVRHVASYPVMHVEGDALKQQ